MRSMGIDCGLKGSVLYLLISLVLRGVGSAQEVETVKATLMKNLEKVENYAAAVIKGRWIGLKGLNENTGQFEFVRDGLWLQFDSYSLSEPEPRRIARKKAVEEIMGTVGMLHTCSFDGKKFYDFDPYDLTFRIESVNRIPPKFAGLPLLPKNWLYGGAERTQFFRRFIDDSDYELEVESLGGGRWKLSQSNMGSLLPEDIRSKFRGVKDRYIIVDEKFDFLVTEYNGKADEFEVASNLDWAQQDGNWYVKHGKQLRNGVLYHEWFIEDISFDASKCRTKFDDLESTIPFATQIDTYDQQKHRISPPTFKGGKDGETEHRLRKMALQKRKKEEGI